MRNKPLDISHLLPNDPNTIFAWTARHYRGILFLMLVLFASKLVIDNVYPQTASIDINVFSQPRR